MTDEQRAAPDLYLAGHADGYVAADNGRDPMPYVDWAERVASEMTFGHDATAQISPLQQLAVDNVDCPEPPCVAVAGEPCRTVTGYAMQTPHTSRSAPLMTAYALGVEQGVREERARHA